MSLGTVSLSNMSDEQIDLEACDFAMKRSGVIANAFMTAFFSLSYAYFELGGENQREGYAWMIGIMAVNTVDSVASIVVPKVSENQRMRMLSHLYRFSPALLSVVICPLFFLKPEVLKPIFIAAAIKAGINGLWALHQRFGRASEPVLSDPAVVLA